jgi:hypothetical protein
MRTGLLLVSSVVAAALFIAASQIIAAGADARSVLPADRLSIAEPRYSGQWKGNDLTVEYSYARDQGQMDFSGNVRFANFLVLGYPRLEEFRLGAIFLDENGKVIEEIALVTNRGSFDPIPFNRRVNVPPNAAFIAFSYQGKAIESGMGGSHTFFSFYPIH